MKVILTILFTLTVSVGYGQIKFNTGTISNIKTYKRVYNFDRFKLSVDTCGRYDIKGDTVCAVKTLDSLILDYMNRIQAYNDLLSFTPIRKDFVSKAHRAAYIKALNNYFKASYQFKRIGTIH